MLKKCHTKNTMTLTRRGKITLLLFVAIILFVIISKLLPKDYKIEYKINNFKIVEKYIKKDKMYTFKLTKNKKTYETISIEGYTTKRNLISKVKEYKKGDTSCIVINSDKIKNNIVCLKNGKKVDYNLTSVLPKKYYKKYKSNKKTYKKIKLNLVDDSTYLVWNYTGFYKISKDKLQTIKLLKKDVYNIDLVIIVDRYLIMADYNEQYNYKKLIKINLENNDVDEIELKEDVSFDSMFIGTYKKYIYLVDRKNKKEYEINYKNGDMETISRNKMGKILKNGKLEKIKLNKIITDNLKFETDNYINYKIDNGLYMYQRNITKPIKISNKEIKDIVYSDDDKVYYIVGEKLYKYDYEHGETKIMDYFELNFNYENIIYIYN